MIQWAKPVVQLVSQTPDFGVDRGKPILVVVPFSLWLGLSFFISFPLWARLEAQRAQKNTLNWLFDTLTWFINVIIQTARAKVKKLKRQGKSRTWGMESGDNRRSGETTLPGSAADGQEGTELERFTSPPTQTHEQPQ